MPSKPAPRKRAAALAGPVFVTRQVHFNAAHRLHNPRKDGRWNRATFGLCNNVHGHNYVLEVTVKGRPDPDTGFVVNLADLKETINRVITDRCDHKDLNRQVDFVRGKIASTENLVIAFWNRLAPHIHGGILYRIRLYETPRNFAEYFGPTPLV